MTRRTVTEPGDGKLARLEQVVIAACKQSGRNRIMTLAPPTPLSDVLVRAGASVQLVVADRAGSPAMAVFPDAHTGDGAASRRPSGLALVGPEGGFTPEELAALEAHGAQRVSLGAYVLRVETAALALAACWIAAATEGKSAEARPGTLSGGEFF
jgi:16S rRNA (uracil1498-N3)-methyltransferase